MENNNIMDEVAQTAVATTNIQSPQEMSIARPMKRTNTVIREYNIGRNDKCPCGSGKKYKNCCLQSGKYEDMYELTNREMNQLRESVMNIDSIRKNVVNR